MKKNYRISQTVMIPHASILSFDMEEEEFKKLMKEEFGIEITADFDETDFDSNSEFTVEHLGEILNLSNDIMTEPDFWGSWVGSYNIWIEKWDTKDEDNSDNS